MKLETFFEKFDQFADAPDAVAKMREMVLELAIQGKLVVQACDDEPAGKQLERIAAKKSQTGRIARVKAGAGGSSAPEDTETHVPDGWAKTSLAVLVTVLNGRAYSKEELLEAGTPVLRVGNLFTSKHWYYSDLELEPDKYCDKGDLIFAWSASFGPFIWRGPKVIYHYHVWKLELHSEADLHKGYLYWFLQNKTQEIKRAGHGVSMLHMTKEKMEKLEVMLPPLAEQKRIVAKVDELMALCDQLEAQQQERETRHASLARASLARFADAPTPANLPFLFHPSYAIPPTDLRKSILTLAVQGKLVPQDPSDEPAEAMVGRNEELNTDASFEIPDQWTWTQLSQIADINGGFAFKSNAYTDKGTRVVRISDFDEFGFKDHKVVRHPFTADLQKFTLAESNILMAMTGGTVGKSYFVRSLPEPMVVNQRVATIKVSANANPSYVDIAIRSELTQEVIRKAKNSTNDNISMGDIKGFAIPLPPLAEQRRIVAKVEQLMTLVDALETQLAASRTTAANLLSALVTELTVNPDGDGGLSKNASRKAPRQQAVHSQP